MSNGVGLHWPDLTAGTLLYTPDELGLDDAEADKVPDGPPPSDREAGETPEGVRGDSGRGVHSDLTEAALEGGYSAATVVELCRFYYDQPTLLAELGDDEAVDMAGRLRLARVQGVSGEAADIWLTFRAADGSGEARVA